MRNRIELPWIRSWNKFPWLRLWVSHDFFRVRWIHEGIGRPTKAIYFWPENMKRIHNYLRTFRKISTASTDNKLFIKKQLARKLLRWLSCDIWKFLYEINFRNFAFLVIVIAIAVLLKIGTKQRGIVRRWVIIECLVCGCELFNMIMDVSRVNDMRC